jgi:dTDP-glucose 4,6-dehydratase
MNPLPPLPREDLEDVFRQVGDAWEKLRGRNVFISGASGFFGSWLLETLLFSADRRQLGVKAWALTRDVNRFRSRLPHLAGHPAVELVGGGVEQFVFPKEKMAYVIHSMVPDPGMPLPEMEKWFEMGSRRLLELAVRDRSEGFLLCSTGAVYQPQNRPLSEEDPLIPLDSPLTYGRIRRQVEDQCLAVSEKEGIPLKIARGFAFAGPRLPENAGFVLADFLRDAKEGRSIRVKGTGEPTRSYLYSADMAVWLWKIFFNPLGNGIFNVGSPEGVRIIEVAEMITTLTHSEFQILGQPEFGASQNTHYVPITKKAFSQLEVTLSRSLPELLHASIHSSQEVIQ